MITPFDRHIRQQIRKEDTPAVPDFVHQMTEATLASLPEKMPLPKRTFSLRKSRAAIAACAAVLMLGVLPNINPVYAKAVADLPVIGPLVRVLTIRNDFLDDGSHLLDAEIPSLDDPANPDAATLINADIDQLTTAAIGRFYSELELNGGGYGSIHIDYETILSTDDWFTLQLRISETSGSSDTALKYYHIDRIHGRYVTFGDLFTAEGYAAFEAYILDEIAARTAADPDVSYWPDEGSTGESLTALTDDQAFYFTADGTLVIVYDKYEIAPGSMGNPTFEIPRSVYEAYLK